MENVPHIYNTQILEKIPFPTKDGLVFVVVAEINYLEAARNYTIIYRTDHTTILVIKRIGEVLKMLPAKTFYRIHNSTAVNCNQCNIYVKEDYILYMENGVKLTVAEGRATGFIAFFLKIKKIIVK